RPLLGGPTYSVGRSADLDGPRQQKETVVKRGFVVAVGGAAIVIAGLAGVSSEKKSDTSGATSSAASAQGKSTVTIDGNDQSVQGTVVCSHMGRHCTIRHA